MLVLKVRHLWPMMRKRVRELHCSFSTVRTSRIPGILISEVLSCTSGTTTSICLSIHALLWLVPDHESIRCRVVHNFLQFPLRIKIESCCRSDVHCPALSLCMVVIASVRILSLIGWQLNTRPCLYKPFACSVGKIWLTCKSAYNSGSATANYCKTCYKRKGLNALGLFCRW